MTARETDKRNANRNQLVNIKTRTPLKESPYPSIIDQGTSDFIGNYNDILLTKRDQNNTSLTTTNKVLPRTKQFDNTSTITISQDTLNTIKSTKK